MNIELEDIHVHLDVAHITSNHLTTIEVEMKYLLFQVFNFLSILSTLCLYLVRNTIICLDYYHSVKSYHLENCKNCDIIDTNIEFCLTFQ